MAVQNYLAGMPVIGQDLPEVGAMLQRKRIADDEMARRNTMLGMEQEQMANARSQQELRERYAEMMMFDGAPPEIKGQWVASQRMKHPEFANTPFAQMPPEQAFEGMKRGLQAKLGIEPKNAGAYSLQTQEGPFGSKIVSDGSRFQVVQPPKPSAPASTQAPAAPAAPSVARLETKETDAQNLLRAVDDAKKLVSGWSAGWFGQKTREQGGTPAFDLNTKIDTIKSIIGFDRLQRMRDESKTGGALGQVAVQELTMLQSTITSLDTAQSPEQLIRALDTVAEQYESAMQAYEAARQEGAGADGKPVAGVTKEDGYIYIGGDPANPKSWVKER